MMKEYNYRFKGQMRDAMESIPLGNGDLGVNVWVKEGVLNLLLSKTDAFSELHRLLKLGHIQVSATPSPFSEDTDFLLELDKGLLTIQGDKLTIKLWVDALHPVYHLESVSKEPVSYKFSIKNYRNQIYIPQADDNSNYHLTPNADLTDETARMVKEINYESADTIFSLGVHSLGQFHHNSHSVYSFTMKHQGLGEFQGEDPLLDRTFGYLIQSPQLELRGEELVSEFRTELNLAITALTFVTDSEAQWKSAVGAIPVPADSFSGHCDRWKELWAKSYLYASGDQAAECWTRGYLYQRYMNLCAGSGEYPVKFNGSIFTCEPSPHNPEMENYDYRRWGGLYWFQNTRLIYWSMLYSGDYQQIRPFLKLYLDILPLAKYRTRKYYQFDGAFIPETITVFGCYANVNYGWNRENKAENIVVNRYIRWYYSGMLEFSFFLLEYYRHTGDQSFLEDQALPFIREILTFYKNRYEMIDGKLLISPGMALETWQNCVDDTPTIAGLQAVIDGVLETAAEDSEIYTLCCELTPAIPDMNFRNINGRTALSPYRINIDEKSRNAENPELYPVFPYRLFRQGKGNQSVGVEAYRNRIYKTSCGWQQHGIQAALLGLSEEAEKELTANYLNTNPGCAFPAFWGPNYDWSPDQDNGGAANIAFTQMLVQSDSDRIDLLPAWNMERNVSFRLPVGAGNFVQAEVEGGCLKSCVFDFEPARKVFLQGKEFEGFLLKS